LQGVDVLELVDVKVPEPPALDLGEGAVVADLARHQGEEVVEVDEAAGPLRLLVGAVSRRHRRRSRPRSPPGARGGRLVVVRRHEAGMGPADLGGCLGRRQGPRPSRRQLPEVGQEVLGLGQQLW
jgi:hypothetical protein